MFPRLSPNYLYHSSLCNYWEHFCNGIGRHSSVIKFPKSLNKLVSKFVLNMPLSLFSAYKSALPNRISCIVPSGSEKKMIRVAARRVIAFMTNAHTFWNFTVCDLPRNSMCLFRIPVNTENPISFIVSVGRPRPTFINRTTLNLFPESILNWSFHIFSVTNIAPRIK